MVFVYGTAKTVTVTATFTITTVNAGAVTVTIDFYITYDGNNDFLIEGDVTYPAEIVAGASNPLGTINWTDITADSTKNASPMYIDLDIGECYKLSNGSMVSVNDAVSLPPELPTLPPGETTITYDNTITLLKVLPRWWKV